MFHRLNRIALAAGITIAVAVAVAVAAAASAGALTAGQRRLRQRPGRLAGRATVVVAALVMAVPVAGTAVSAQAAVPGAATAPAAQTSQAVPAAGHAGSAAPRLARAVAGAKTTAARVAAIDEIMSVLHVDVINPANGAVVVKGAARSLNDAYLYVNEIERIAVAYPAGRRVSLGQLAAELDLVYAKLGMKLTAANLGKALLAVIKSDSARSAPDSTALVSRLIWQLGLLHKPAQNLAGNVPAAKVSLDPLQAWLVTADLTLPLIYANAPPKSASHLSALTDGLVGHGAVPSVDACRALKEMREGLSFSDKLVLDLAKDILGKSVTWPVLVQKAAVDVADLIDLVHGVLTGIGVQVTSSIDPAKTSLGGPPMQLTVGVIMTLHLPQWVVDCGWLAGADFPGHGGVPGVKVIWLNDPLSDWGTFDCPAVGCTKTAADGIARETFNPRKEDVKHGFNIVERGTVKALTLINFSLDNKLGFLADIIRDQGAMVWELSHNQVVFPEKYTAHLTYKDFYEKFDLTLTGTQAPPTKKYCPLGQDKVCDYTVDSITGTFTWTYGGCPQQNLPPYAWPVPPVPGGWEILSGNPGGSLTLKINLDPQVGGTGICASEVFPLGMFDYGTSVIYPAFEPGTTTTKAPLYGDSGVAGTADVTWTYAAVGS